MKIKSLSGILLLCMIVFSIPLVNADVADIDADVLDNVTFESEGYEMVHNVEVTWTATKSGYVYFMFYDYVCGEPGGTDVSISGNPVYIGQADTKPWPAGAPINVYRMGYVENGTEYSWSGIVKDDACGGCPDDNISYFPIISGYSGNGVATHPAVSYTENECSGVRDYTAFLLIESSPPTYTLSGYVTDTSDNPIQSATVTLSDSGGEDVTNVSGYYEITEISSDNYGITATATSFERYSDYVSVTEDTIKNISMVLDTTETVVSPIVAPPPLYTEIPTPTKTDIPIADEENGDSIIDEIIDIVNDLIVQPIENLIEFFDETFIEPTKVIIEEVIVHISSTFNWMLLVFVYLSTLVGRIVNKIEDAVTLVIDTALYGTIALIVILLLSFIGLAFIFSNELIAVIVFVVTGFGFGMLPEYLKKEDSLGKK